MSYIDRYLSTSTESFTLVEQEAKQVVTIIETLPAHLLTPYNWRGEDDEPIDVDKDYFKWVKVTDPRTANGQTLDVAAVITEDEDKHRYFTLIGRLPDGTCRDMAYLTRAGIGHPIGYNLALNMRENIYDSTFVPWESADAQLFLTLAKPAVNALEGKS